MAQSTAARRRLKRFAKWLRFWSQSVLGALIFLSLFVSVAWRSHAIPGLAAGPLQAFFTQPTLAVVADGLALSAGIDLAYMLTTDGPDEAIVPLITGLASAVLLIAADEPKLDPYRILEIGILILLIVFLYYFAEKKGLLKDEEEEACPCQHHQNPEEQP